MPAPPPTDEDARYIRTLITTVGELAQQLGTTREQIKEDTALLLRTYREDVHRSIMAIHVRIVSLEDTIETDRASRVGRQKTLDSQIAVIQANQRFLVRLAVVAGLVAIGVVIGWLVL